ncbi:tRNA (mnm(5)s(2)U34)-methyltransferase [Piscibacillus halophilus]|uniref:tRNA (mnm(5)s(2)U34)-methyltransferase n=1 Tax=Piscibacillus halophilus TaxID=571933 RepID=UPI001589BF38|nr:class I SAM-dependent methyltransferase [Piscibacillus halophilus]
MKQIIPFAHDLLSQSVTKGSVVVDATLGNGHDSLFLSRLVGEHGNVYSFDVQQEAIDQSDKLFNEQGIHNVTSILTGHENAKDQLTKRGIHEIDGCIFNLGFLPGSDHSVTTSSYTTIEAINQIFSLLKPERYIVIVVYPGHEEGRIEKEKLITFLKSFPAKRADIAQYRMVNRSDKAPFVVALYKK